MSMLGHPAWYFGSMRKYVTLVGSLFDNIQISRTDANGNRSQLISVPITYAAKDKMLTRVVSDPKIDRPEAVATLPLISFEMTGLKYDGTRKLVTVNRSASISTTSKNFLQYQYNPVPYNFSFKVYIYVKNVEDGTKIVEQILPFFTPDWTPTVTLIPEMNQIIDIPIVLNNVGFDDQYDGDFKERRVLIWTLDLTVKGFLYGPVKTNAVIKFVNTTFFIANTVNISDSVDVIGPAERIDISPGLTANGLPTSNSTLTVPYSQIEAADDYGFITNIENIES